MKGRGWMVLGGLGVLVLVLVLLRGGTTQRQSPNHASTSDAADGTSALRAYADALGYPSGSVEGTFSLPAAAGLLFVFTPSNGFSADQVAQLNSWMQAGGVVVYAAEEGDPQLDTQFGLRRSGTGVSAKAHAAAPIFGGVESVGGADAAPAFKPTATQVPLLRNGARRVTLEALLAATRRAVAQRVGLGADVPSDRLTATIAQRAPAAAAELSRAERELELATAGEAEVLEMARRLHDLAYPLSMKESA